MVKTVVTNVLLEQNFMLEVMSEKLLIVAIALIFGKSHACFLQVREPFKGSLFKKGLTSAEVKPCWFRQLGPSSDSDSVLRLKQG